MQNPFFNKQVYKPEILKTFGHEIWHQSAGPTKETFGQGPKPIKENMQLNKINSNL